VHPVLTSGYRVGVVAWYVYGRLLNFVFNERRVPVLGDKDPDGASHALLSGFVAYNRGDDADDYSPCFGGSSYQTEMAITATLRFTGLPVR
jgi:hypothetical protein